MQIFDKCSNFSNAFADTRMLLYLQFILFIYRLVGEINK